MGKKIKIKIKGKMVSVAYELLRFCLIYSS
jgi:hypothetical protein